MKPEEIAEHKFLVGLRGYDREQVETYLRDLARYAQSLETQLHDALNRPEPAPPAPPTVDEAARILGEEIAQIVVAARAGAEEILKKSRAEAAELLADARRDLAEVRREIAERKTTAEDEIRSLAEARDRLATQLGDVRRRLEETVARLAPVEAPPSTIRPAERSPAATEAGPAPTTPSAPPVKKREPGQKPKSSEKIQRSQALPVPAMTKVPEPRSVVKSEPMRVVKIGVRPPLADDLAVFMQRTELLGDASASAGRRIKRLLQEDQNELLDRLRTARASAADALLPLEEQIERFHGGLSEILSAAFLAGRTAGGLEGGDPEEAVGSLVRKQFLVPLRSDVSRVIEAGFTAKDSAAAISERANDVFRVWKGVRTDLLGEGLVFAAFHAGVLDALVARGTEKKRWVFSPQEQDCPRGICKVNVDGGATPTGSVFASGHNAPPAHGGCSCTVIGEG